MKCFVMAYSRKIEEVGIPNFLDKVKLGLPDFLDKSVSTGFPEENPHMLTKIQTFSIKISPQFEIPRKIY